MGAYIRPPEPASLYRMHAAANGCYRVRNIAIDNELVVTNRTPVGLNRGYGGPQFYFALERLMDIAARGLASIRRSCAVATSFRRCLPYRGPGWPVFDAGDYGAALDELCGSPTMSLQATARRRGAPGRVFGIGFAAGVEPSGSNMAYVSLAADGARSAQPRRPEVGRQRQRGAVVDPSGQVTLRLCTTPNGQGHATVAAQIVADALGL